jgi:hypothetical protein
LWILILGNTRAKAWFLKAGGNYGRLHYFSYWSQKCRTSKIESF